MTDKPPDARTAWATKQFENIDNEIARLSTICRVDFRDRTNIESGIRNDASVCGSNNTVALQPLSVGGQVGLNVFGGIGALELRVGQ